MRIRCFGDEELANLKEVIEGQELWRGHGDGFVSRFEDAAAGYFGRKYAYAVNTGTSADEAAIAGLGLEPGDEVICPSFSPIFAAMPVLAAGCIPVFADVDPRTGIITAEDIEARISPRTRAVLVVHLYGQPALMDEILQVAAKHGLKVIEDCAQSMDSMYKGRKVGTIGDVACFSLQQSKHMTSGEGGLVLTDDPEIYKRVVLYSNTGMPWYRYGLETPVAEPVAGIPTRGHFAFGHNHRMSELEGAVALAQLAKLPKFNEARKPLIRAIVEELSGLSQRKKPLLSANGCPGIELPAIYPDTVPNYWAYGVRLNPEVVKLTATQVETLYGGRPGPGHYNEIVYMQQVFQEMERARRTPFGYPLPKQVSYAAGLCPKAEDAALRTLAALVHHSYDVETVRREWRTLREVVDGLLG